MENLIVDDIQIGYKFQEAKYDRKHLIVIFSGFRKKGTFDFEGKALSKLTANILWIDDCFDGKYSYYMRHRRGEDLAHKINKFIESKLDELGLNKHQCTLSGFSKGGSAALYYAARFGYRNIVITVPQFFIGRYITSAWNECITSMTPTGSPEELLELDNILIRELEYSNKEKNIYLFTSPADYQYESEIVPNLSLMRKFDNFNLITSETPLITRHNQVTKYNVPGIIAILSLLAEDIQPIIGEIGNGAGRPEQIEARTPNISLGEMHASVESSFIRNGRLFLTGYALFENHVSDTWGSQKNWLVFNGKNHKISSPLGQISDENVNGKYYSEPFINHSHASFATVGHKGINVTGLPDGKYELSLAVEVDGVRESSARDLGATADLTSYHDGRVYRLRKNDKEFSLSVVSFKNLSNSDCYFDPIQNEILESKLFLKGYLVPPGIDIEDWKSVRYFVEFSEISRGERIYRPAACDHKLDIAERTGNFFNDQSKAFYATKGYKGIELSSLPQGEYEVRVVGLAATSIFASPKLDIVVDVQKEHSTTIDIIGACVSRDVFNSKITPNWRRNFSITGQAFQSSLISLMARPTHIADQKILDLGEHDRRVVRQDFAKDYVAAFAKQPPEIILVDFFTDSRFGVIGYDGTWVTDNDWKIGKAQFYQQIDQTSKVSMWTDESAYLDLFSQACERFRDLLAGQAPETKVLVNSTRCVTHHRANGVTKAFSKKFVDQQNDYWNKLEAVFVSIVPCEIVKMDFKDILGDSKHLWGPGPVHYESEFYQLLYRELLVRTNG
ncbi:accessory Sec system protein Asp2 [Glutamicibacter sp. AGC46]